MSSGKVEHKGKDVGSSSFTLQRATGARSRNYAAPLPNRYGLYSVSELCNVLSNIALDILSQGCIAWKRTLLAHFIVSERWDATRLRSESCTCNVHKRKLRATMQHHSAMERSDTTAMLPHFSYEFSAQLKSFVHCWLTRIFLFRGRATVCERAQYCTCTALLRGARPIENTHGNISTKQHKTGIGHPSLAAARYVARAPSE